MGPASGDKGEYRLDICLAELRDGGARDRQNALKTLREIFDKPQKAPNVENLTDKAYHGIFEDIFKVAVTEKQNFLTTKGKTTPAAALTRLNLSIDALRAIIRASVGKLKVKTVQAIIDHITQTLPNADGEYCAPISHNYLKALSEILDHKAHVEHLKHDTWLYVVDFCLRGIGQYLNDNSGELLSRNSPSLNASYASRSIPKLSRINSQSQDQAAAVSRRNAEDLLQCLLSLVSAPNAPVLEKAQELADGVMSFLRLQGSTASQSHQLVFCITNVILSFTFVDKTSLTQTIAHDAIPIICQLWQGKTVAKDEMLNSVMDEMLILLLNVHLHLERSIRDGLSGDLTQKLVDLLDVMRAEYAKRSGRDRLQLDDLEMAYLHASANASPFQLNTFQLKPHNIRAERGWAILQVIGILENLVSLGNEDGTNEESEGEDELLNDDNRRSRKRRRLSGSRDRLLDPLDSADAGSRLTSLQAIPFILNNRQLSADTLRKLLGQLGSLVGDKRMSIDSWALLAIARQVTLTCCTLQEASSEYPPEDWVFLWQIGCRSLTLATTCRVASAQLHWILARDLVPYHDIAEDVNAMVTSADVNGPAVMCDSAVLLMMHLLHVRVVEIPGSSLQACRHVIRWLFDKWKSSEHAKTPAHVQPSYILDLLRTTLGLPSLPMPATVIMPCGSIAHAWQRLLESQDILRYLLLLDGPSSKSASCEFCPKRSATDEVCFFLDTSQFRESRKLVLELLLPKYDSLLQVWKSSSTDHSSHISMDTFRTTIDTCISGFLLVPYFSGSSMRQMDAFKDTLDGLKIRLLAFVQDSQGTQTFIEVLLQHLQPYLPQCRSAEVARIVEHNPELLEFCSVVAADLDRRRNALTESLGTTDDMMDLDDEFPTQISHTRIETQRATVSRQHMALDLSHFSFNRVVSERLTLLSVMSKQTDSVGILPSEFIDHLLLMADEEVLACQSLICDVLHSDLTISEADALRLLEHVGSIMTSTEYERCETAQVLCVEVLAGLMSFWSTEDDSNLVEAASEIYQWFIEVALQKDIVSPLIQKGLAKLLLDLLQVKPNFGEGSLTSPRTRLLEILKKGNIPVKFFIGNKLPEIFGRYVLKKHDEIFMDVLDVLPTASEEGISFRLFIIAKLGARWSTLLRRCVYHILEVPGKEPGSIKHASRCLNDLSRVLKVKGPEELFSLFAPQVLFTWLEYEKIEDIPYQIFGYNSLSRLLEDFQDELVALMMMRGQEDAAERLARALELPLLELLQKWFSKTMAYVVGRDLNPTDEERRDPQHTKYEVRLRKFMQKEEFLKCINEHFPDIIAMFFNTIDIVNITKSDSFERSLRKDVKLAYAADIMADIKSLSTSNAELPDSQQPFFRAKYFKDELYHICKRTVHQEVTELYTPALVTSIARKLFDTIHPALGSLHACAVLRKVSVLISLSGAAALNGYPLEMLLQSVRPFITDPECADDAIGIMRYLLDRGIAHLKGSPSFLAGIALSSLGPLRVFLKSSQSTTTQESQYRATMTKAQDFHTWMGKYIAEYDSPALKDHSKETLHSMLESAHRIRSVGNAEIDSPESNLLLKLLEDEQRTRGLLSKPSRKLALATLSAQFDSPTSFRNDILGADALAVSKAAVVWKSCSGEAVGDQYLCWAARVLGRAFLSSGHVDEELLRESALRQIKELSTSPKSIDSRACLLDLVQALTLGNDQRAVGLAESALRKVVSASHEADFEICQQILSKSLYLASAWEPYLIPPSDVNRRKSHLENQKASFAADGILLSSWLRDLAISLVHYVEDDVLLSALEPILQEVGGFADDAFPFILHLVLSAQFEGQQTAKRQFSDAVANWFGASDGIDKNNLKVLINSILYLRTQPLPQERSSADRAHWLEIDYKNAAVAAANCGMFKTALLFVEEHQSTPVKSSRRSSVRVGSETADMPTELLLRIFKSIDDPDMYYGVQQTASLRTILSRLEYEKDGARSLAFRGAQYDSHLRRQDLGSAQDAQSLVKALDVLNLSGLSHSLLQSQQTVGMDSTSLESMFRTARKLEQWDIPVPSTCNNTAVTIYKAFQGIHTATDRSSILDAVNDSLYNTMNGIIRKDLSGSALRDCLQSLAVLTELDEVLSSQGSEQFEEMLSRFEGRSLWMKTGRFDDISQILSCRGTTLSTLSQHTRLRDIANVRPEDTRLVEVQAALLSSKLNRAHNALQESLSLATSLMDLIKPCHDVGLRIEAASHLEAANALWDQGEMTSSIGMLQALNKDSSLKNQTIPVGHSDLLSKIGHQISVARLEKPDHIIENYLQPALKELKGKNKGSVASQVFHQFAVFCDQQLEDPDSLEDLKRLEKLTHMKQTEVDEIAKLLKTCNANDKNRYKGHHIKAKQWLKLDREELQRQNSNRDEFLRQSLENYLLALGASDDHDHSALRFTALWLQYSEKELANTAVSAHLDNAPSRKFASLMNQLTSRLLDNGTEFQKLLFDLVLRICTDHPYHGMYQISAGTNTRANSKDDTAVSRLKAQKKIGAYLQRSPKVADIWSSVCNTNKAYCRLAAEKDDAKYKGGKKIPLKDSDCGRALWSAITKWHIPPPTMQVDIRLNLDYTEVPFMTSLESQMTIASGVSAPKIITAIASNGRRYKQLVKGGNDDLRQDAIMEQVFAQVSELLKENRASRQRNLSIRTYKVLPLTASAGVIEFVPNTIPLHDYIMPAHERIYPKDFKSHQCRREISDAQTKSLEVRVAKFRSVTEKFHPVMRYFFIEKFEDPDEWFVKRLAYTRSTAAISILGHVLGLGDRHGHNILLDSESGEVVHIDLGVAFEMGRVLPVPELVPFRLTRDIVDGMGITKTEGVFRRCCEFTLEALRENVYLISTILDVLRYDPLYSWSISPVRLAKLQDAQSAAHEPAPSVLGEEGFERTKEVVNEPSEADRALEVVNKKLSKTLSVSATVNDLINQATDERNLAVLYSGWAAYA